MTIRREFDAAETEWRRLEAQCAVSPYQTFAFCRAYMETLGAAHGETPLIAVVHAGGRVDALLPLAIAKQGPLRLASFQGDRMANYKMGLFRDPELWTRDELRILLKRVGRLARIDCFLFDQQPLTWRGRRNPLGDLGGDPSPSFAYATKLPAHHKDWLAAHYSASARKKRRAKTRKLEAFGKLELRTPSSDDDVDAALTALRAQKRARMTELKLPNAFDEPATVSFLARLNAERIACGFEWRLAFAGDRIVSAYAGFRRDGRLSGLLFSHDVDPGVAAASPGEWLLLALAEEAHGLDELDFGVGEARYKSEACEIVEPMIDLAFPVTLAGRAVALIHRALRRLKRRIKHSPRLFDAARAVQRWSFKRPAR